MKTITTGIVALLFLFALTVKAQTYYSLNSASGTWGGSWSTIGCGGASCGCTPGSTVEICSGTTVTFSGALTVGPGGNIGTLTIDGGGTLIVTGSTTFKNGSVVTVKTGGSLQIGGSFQNNNNSNSVVVDGSMTVAGAASFGNGSTITGTGTVAVSGSTGGAGTVFGVSPGCTACTFQTGGSSPLPITLAQFNATYNNGDGSVTLNWVTATETNNKFFTIERSVNGDFTPVTQVAGAGNSATYHYYTTVDPNPVTGIIYYRLKQTDYDGNYTYSDVVPVNVTETKAFTIFPNPVTSTLMLSYYVPAASNMDIKVLDVTGQEIATYTIAMQEGNTTYSMDVSSLSKGVYFIRAIVGNQTFVKKFVK